MFRRKHHVRGTEQRVGARREHAHGCIGSGHREVDLRAVAAADPVRLRLSRGVGPVERLDVVEQARRVLADLEVPLRQTSLLHDRIAAFAQTRDDLLVREHRLARRAPVHRAVAALHESAVVQLQEDPLRPLVVLGRGRIDGVVPVEHAADALQLPREVRDVARNQVVRIRLHLQRIVFRVDAERVETDRFEHRFAAQAPVAAVHVGAGERIDVADVQPFRGRIREHHQVDRTGPSRARICASVKVFVPRRTHSACHLFSMACGS